MCAYLDPASLTIVCARNTASRQGIEIEHPEMLREAAGLAEFGSYASFEGLTHICCICCICCICLEPSDALLGYELDSPVTTGQHDMADGMLVAIHQAAATSYASAWIESDPADLRRELLQGVRFSARFIVTYQAVLCAVVLCFAVWHWSGRVVARWRPIRSGSETVNNSTSSSSSTISGNATPPDVARARKYDEQSPLLNKHKSSKKPRPLQRSLRAIRALGIYQPQRIPLLHKPLPSNSTTLLILSLLAINIFYATFNIHWKLELAFVFSDRTAWMFVANLPWLYLLAAKNQPIKSLTGYSYENLNIVHRRLGEIMCLLALVHGAGMVAAWYCLLRPTGMTIWHFLSLPIIVLGLSALASFDLLYLTSLASFRQWWYEVFLGLHVVLQTAGLVLVFFHHRNGRIYVGIALAIFLIDRLVFRLVVKSRSTRADLTVMEDGETVLVSADWPLMNRWRNMLTALLGLDVRYGWSPTEHVFLTIPAMARKHILQAHPFTIASSAPARGQDHALFNLIIRAHDGFTRDLLHYAQTHTTATIRLDGPYGCIDALHMLQSSDVALVVVGGSGIAVAYPLVWALLHGHDAEGGRPRRRVGLIWVVHEASHVAWIGQERLDELREMGLRVAVPVPTSKAGRPDVAALAEATVHEMAGDEGVDCRVGVVVSGPDSMNRAVRNRCASMAWRGMDVNIAVEKYGW
ncbi:hypothetical protein LTR12_013475 [Friedmanniomyces endolithicus]|nr:hypothetical protein LTR12_013475 [Friedmanniomyces endolithicus]